MEYSLENPKGKLFLQYSLSVWETKQPGQWPSTNTNVCDTGNLSERVEPSVVLKVRTPTISMEQDDIACASDSTSTQYRYRLCKRQLFNEVPPTVHFYTNTCFVQLLFSTKFTFADVSLALYIL